MSNDPTPAEVERAKRWAAMQTPPVEIRLALSITGPHQFWLGNLPYFIDSRNVGLGEFTSANAAWHALALALRPVFASIGPVIEAEVHERWERAVGHGITTAEELASMS